MKSGLDWKISYCSLFLPDEAGKAPGFTITAKGIKLVEFTIGTKWITINIFYSARRQYYFGNGIKIRHPFAGGLTFQKQYGILITDLIIINIQKSVSDLLTNLKMAWANYRCEIGKQCSRLCLKIIQGSFQYSRSQSTPSGMGNRYFFSCLITEKNRQAVSCQHTAGDIIFSGIDGIRFNAFSNQTLIKSKYLVAMNL